MIVQTLSPDARPIALAAGGEDERFYADEVDRRRGARLPAGDVASSASSSLRPSADKAQKAAAFVAERLGPRLAAGEQLLGPGPLVRERGRYQARLLIKTPALGNTLDVLRPWVDHYRPRFAQRGARLVVDVEPQWL